MVGLAVALVAAVLAGVVFGAVSVPLEAVVGALGRAFSGQGRSLADAVVLDVDSQGVQVQWSENSNAEDFARNLIRARVEGRFGTSVLSPLGVVIATLD